MTHKIKEFPYRSLRKKNLSNAAKHSAAMSQAHLRLQVSMYGISSISSQKSRDKNGRKRFISRRVYLNMKILLKMDKNRT